MAVGAVVAVFTAVRHEAEVGLNEKRERRAGAGASAPSVMRYKSDFKNKTADHSLHTLLNARTVGAGADGARYRHMRE